MYRRWGRLGIRRADWERLLRSSRCWTVTAPGHGLIALVTVGRLHDEPGVVDLALQVTDSHQRRGIGTLLARHATENARQAGAHTLSVYTQADNMPMLRLVSHLGPAQHLRDGPYVDIRLDLRQTVAPDEEAPA